MAEPVTFETLAARDWREVLTDSGTDDWRDNWFVDGHRHDLRNTPEGMVYSAGPVAQDHASHSVLWTRDSFAGDLRIRLRYTRLDTISRFVNILYIQATGIGGEDYPEDIAAWTAARQIPFMHNYFNTMNLLHISYAAFGNQDDKDEDYVRARRYPACEARPWSATDIAPDNFLTGLFRPGVSYDFDVIKTDADLYFEVKNAEVRTLFHWPLGDVELVTHGRVGIRHMWTRCSRYADIRIYTAG